MENVDLGLLIGGIVVIGKSKNHQINKSGNKMSQTVTWIGAQGYPATEMV